MISASSMIPGKNGPQPPPSHGILKSAIPLHSLHSAGHAGQGQTGQGHTGQGHAGQTMDSRMRMDSQKFLVPSLPLSGPARHEPNVGVSHKRRDRSLLNGNLSQDRENGRRYDAQTRLTSQGQGQGHGQGQQHSPRQRESMSPYSDLVIHHPYQMSPNPSYQMSSSTPSPNASPKAMSPPNKSTPRGSFSPGGHGGPLTSGGHAELNLSGRLYPSAHSSNGYHTLGIQGHHAAFFAAASAYPLFGGPPSHYAAASSYLDSFHSGILAQQMKATGSISTGSISTGPASNYLNPHLRIPYHPLGTSTTSLHPNLIESSSESRYNTHVHHPGIPRNGEYLMSVPKGEPTHAQKKMSNGHEGSGQRSWSDRDNVTPLSYGRQFPKMSQEPSQYEPIRADPKRIYPNRDKEGIFRQRKPIQESGDEAGSKVKVKQSSIFTFPPEVPLALRNGHGQDLHKSDLGHVQNPFQPPESPKKRKVPAELSWNFSNPQSILTKQSQKSDLKSPPLVPRSPSYYKVPKSPSVTFKSTPKVPPSPKKVLQNHNENAVNSRSLLLAPIPVEQMPVLAAFRQGSLIQLASGEVKSVENLCGEDFTHSAAQMLDAVSIVYCKVLAVQEVLPPSTNSSNKTPVCKITLGMEKHKQQVVLDATLEQPFFVLSRGWSSLSPEMSKKLLELECSSLQVGDICMTLARSPGKRTVQGSKPKIASKGPGTDFQETTSNNPQIASKVPASSSAKKTLETDVHDNSVTQPTKSSDKKSIAAEASQPPVGSLSEIPANSEDSSAPPSPKKRRLSSPEEVENQQNKETKSGETLPEEIEVD